MILAIDPGNKESAYVVIDENNNLYPMTFLKTENERLLNDLSLIFKKPFNVDKVVIEKIASYGMAVGAEVFETCIWIGRFMQECFRCGVDVEFIYRKDEKINLCHTMKAKDSNIRQALIDRFGKVGTKKNPGWFYGFKADIWQAYAVGVTYSDLYLRKEV